MRWSLTPRICHSVWFLFLLFRGWWGLGLLSRVECEMLQRRAIVLQCFVLLYKKEEINTHFLLHALGSTPPPHPPLDPAGEAQLGSKTDSTSFQGQKCKLLILHLAVRLFEASHILAQVIKLLTSVTSWRTELGERRPCCRHPEAES